MPLTENCSGGVPPAAFIVIVPFAKLQSLAGVAFAEEIVGEAGAVKFKTCEFDKQFVKEFRTTTVKLPAAKPENVFPTCHVEPLFIENCKFAPVAETTICPFAEAQSDGFVGVAETKTGVAGAVKTVAVPF